uniref:Major facilitator superfamily (MFS) profile domain-containing protein n=1 Tax=Panagrolaimus superbus TaxID=310955 RepID=A0A914YH19_9BILA
MNHRLILVTIFHAIFSTFGDIEACVLNFMNVPLRHFFNESLHYHYDVSATEAEFNLIFSAIASTMFIGILVGGFTMGYMMDYYGRKATGVYIRSFLGIVSALCMIMARMFLSIEFFVVGHFLAGPLCLPSIFGNDSSWWGLPAFCLGLAVIHLLVGSVFPKSPKYLYITENKKQEAMFSISFYHGDQTDIELIEEEYDRERAIMTQGHISLKQVWDNPTLRWSLLICLVCGFVPACSAINVKSQYQIAMYIRFGMTQSQATLALMILSFATFPLCIIAPLAIEKMGRRPLFLSVSALCIFELVFLMFAHAFCDFHFNLPTITSIIGFLGTLGGQVALMMGLLNLTPIMISELCPHVARAPVGQVVQVIPIIVCFISVLTYPVTVARFGALYFFPLIIVSSILFYLLYQNLPETAGLPVDRIVRRLTITTRSRQASVSALIHGIDHHHHHQHYGTLINDDDNELQHD